MTLPTRLKFRAWAPVLNGDGDHLSLVLDAIKPTRAGDASWRGVLEVEVDRHMIRKLAEQIREMQKRDRARLARERDRLAREIEPLTTPAESQEMT